MVDVDCLVVIGILSLCELFIKVEGAITVLTNTLAISQLDESNT